MDSAPKLGDSSVENTSKIPQGLSMLENNTVEAASPNPWSDSQGQTLIKGDTEVILVPADVEAEKLNPEIEVNAEDETHHTLHTPDPSTFDKMVTDGFAADLISPTPLVSPPATEILQEFDPLADQEEEYAKKVWGPDLW